MSEHYELIRHNPSYRLYCMLEELQAEMQPSLSQEPTEQKEAIVYLRPIHFSLNLDKKALELQKRIHNLEELVRTYKKKDGF